MSLHIHCASANASLSVYRPKEQPEEPTSKDHPRPSTKSWIKVDFKFYFDERMGWCFYDAGK